MVTVEATKVAYRVLKHEPSGASIDPETGRGEWPEDQFTFRLREEGAIRVLTAEEVANEAGKSAPGKKG